jgi:methylamine dehydrogenase accessory protein MauD
LEAFQTGSIVVLFVMQGLIILVMLVVARQVGIILARVGPAVARGIHDSAPVGLPVEDFELQADDGSLFVVEASKRSLLVFLSSSCPMCAELMPGLLTLVARPPEPVQVLALSCRAEQPGDKKYFGRLKRGGVPFVRSSETCSRFGVTSQPYAILLESGVIKAKGVVNNLQHLESLFATTTYQFRSVTGHAIEQRPMEVQP